MIPAAVRHADVCVCVSHHTARRLEELVRHRRADGRRREVVVIPHGVDHERFRPDARRRRRPRAARRSLGVRPPFVAFLGTIEPAQGRAVAGGGVRRGSRPAIPTCASCSRAAPGGTVARVQRAIAGSGMAHRIVRTGYVPDDGRCPRCCAAPPRCVYPSLEEGFGLPALEALACARAARDDGRLVDRGVRRRCRAARRATGDVDALTAALERALDPAVARVLTARGPAQAAPYTWDAVADAHLAGVPARLPVGSGLTCASG